MVVDHPSSVDAWLLGGIGRVKDFRLMADGAVWGGSRRLRSLSEPRKSLAVWFAGVTARRKSAEGRGGVVNEPLGIVRHSPGSFQPWPR